MTTLQVPCCSLGEYFQREWHLLYFQLLGCKNQVVSIDMKLIYDGHKTLEAILLAYSLSLYTRRAPPPADIRVSRVLFPAVIFSYKSTILTWDQVPYQIPWFVKSSKLHINISPLFYDDRLLFSYPLLPPVNRIRYQVPIPIPSETGQISILSIPLFPRLAS